MACEEFEILLLEYAELRANARRGVDAHVAVCEPCRELLDSLAAVDSSLSAHFASTRVPPDFTQSVHLRIQRETPARRPSFLPEVLDFVGWAAIITLLGMTLYWLIPQLPANAALNATAAAFVLISVLVGLRSLLEH